MTKLQFVYACSDQAGDCSLCTTASKPSANYLDLLAVRGPWLVECHLTCHLTGVLPPPPARSNFSHRWPRVLRALLVPAQMQSAYDRLCQLDNDLVKCRKRSCHFLCWFVYSLKLVAVIALRHHILRSTDSSADA